MTDAIALLRADLSAALVNAGFALHDSIGNAPSGGDC